MAVSLQIWPSGKLLYLLAYHTTSEVTTSEVTDLIFEISDLNYLNWHGFLASKCHYLKIVLTPFVTHWAAYSYLVAAKNELTVWYGHDGSQSCVICSAGTWATWRIRPTGTPRRAPWTARSSSTPAPPTAERLITHSRGERITNIFHSRLYWFSPKCRNYICAKSWYQVVGQVV